MIQLCWTVEQAMEIGYILSNLATLQPQPATGSTSPVRTKTPEPTVEPTPMQSKSIKLSLANAGFMLVATCLICLQLHYKSQCQQRMHIIYGHLWGTCMHMPLGAPKTSTMWFKPLSTRHPNSTNLAGCLQLQGEAISVRLLVYLSTWELNSVHS